MVCPKCGCETNDEFAEFVRKVDVVGIAYSGYNEVYEVECEHCGCRYEHIAQYEISLFGEKDVEIKKDTERMIEC